MLQQNRGIYNQGYRPSPKYLTTYLPLQVVVYKERDPLPYTTTWYSMVEQGIVNANMEEVIMQNGVLKDQGLITTWLDGTVQDYRWHTS